MSRSSGSRFSILLIALTLVAGGCSGEDAAAGPTSLVEVDEEPSGDNCEAGGVAIARGIDADGDGALSAEEIASAQFACNAVADPSAASLVATMPVPVGDDACPAGGTALSSGTDADGDGMLDASEVADTQMFCNAEVIATEVLAGGDANCPTGGVAVHRGADADGDGALDSGEQASTDYVCNGANLDGSVICLPPARWNATEARCVNTGDWSDSDLADADLGSTYLAGVDLSGADLSGASLAWSDLHGAVLVGADLSGADLSHANVDGADLTDAVLDGANLAGVDLRDATLERTVASGLVECPDRMPDGWSCVMLGEQGKTLIGPGSSLSGLDLSAVDLSDASLDGVQVIDLVACPMDLPPGYACLDLPATGNTLVGPGADLSELDLSGADFSSVMNLRDVTFAGSNLNGATFAAATNLNDTSWTGADLTGVSLTGTNLQGASGTELIACPASLPGGFLCVDLAGTGNTLIGPGTDLSGFDLSGANLANVNLSNANLQDADLSNAVLTSADLSDADLEGANLTGATLNGADLDGARLEGATLIGVQAANLDNCPDSRPELWTCKDGTLLGPEANLSGLDLSGLDFSGNGTHLEGADLSDANLSDTQLSDAHLNGADFSSADLTNASLESANLTDAVLDGADLTDANLNDANIAGASFAGATFDSTTCPNGMNSDSNGNTCL